MLYSHVTNLILIFFFSICYFFFLPFLTYELSSGIQNTRLSFSIFSFFFLPFSSRTQQRKRDAEIEWGRDAEFERDSESEREWPWCSELKEEEEEGEEGDEVLMDISAMVR